MYADIHQFPWYLGRVSHEAAIDVKLIHVYVCDTYASSDAPDYWPRSRWNVTLVVFRSVRGERGSGAICHGVTAHAMPRIMIYIWPRIGEAVFTNSALIVFWIMTRYQDWKQKNMFSQRWGDLKSFGLLRLKYRRCPVKNFTSTVKDALSLIDVVQGNHEMCHLVE